MKVGLKKLREDAKIPVRATDGAAAWDLYTTGVVNTDTLRDQKTYGTGIALEIPKGYVGLVFSRSGHTKIGKNLANAVGVIDSDYRGEILVKLKNYGKTENWAVGDRIAQLMIIKHQVLEFEEVDQLDSSNRGSGGFGSTNKRKSK